MDYSHYRTGQTKALVASLQGQIDRAIAAGDVSQLDEGFFLQYVSDLALLNLTEHSNGEPSLADIEGGPFAALIIQYQARDGQPDKPVVVGLGANHVIPEHDPSAHAEVVAIRDACARLGYSDLSGSVLFSSCECCPQCQAFASSVGISKIVFANDRHDAADAGFSDEEQYRHMERLSSYMTALDDSILADRKPGLLHALGAHDAVMLDEEDQVVACGDIDQGATDPTMSLPSMQTIISTCRLFSSHHIPLGYTLLTRRVIHPAAFVTADWARIGRVRDPLYPDDPQKDAFEKNPLAIIYCEDHFEEMYVKDAAGHVHVLHTSEAVLNDLCRESSHRLLVPTVRTNIESSRRSAIKAFTWWKKAIQQHNALKY